MDIELAVDAEHVDQIDLFSGDGDFRSLVAAVQRVTVVSTISSQPPTNCGVRPTSSRTWSSYGTKLAAIFPNVRHLRRR